MIYRSKHYVILLHFHYEIFVAPETATLKVSSHP